jgi:hypothetical protein
MSYSPIYTNKRVYLGLSFEQWPGEIVYENEATWAAAQSTQRNPEGLLLWLYQDPDYLALMDAYPGRIASFERAIAEDRLIVAQALWDGLDVSAALLGKLAQQLSLFGYSDLLERLYPNEE